MARPSGPKTRNGGQWTESRFNTFVRNLLRSGTRKWNPIHQTKKEARVSRGMYECADCGNIVPPTIKVGRKRVNNVHVDHIEPVVDPDVGFTNFDEYIERLFTEKENLQLLCGPCHDRKTQEERQRGVERRRKEKHIREPVENEGNPII